MLIIFLRNREERNKNILTANYANLHEWEKREEMWEQACLFPTEEESAKIKKKDKFMAEVEVMGVRKINREDRFSYDDYKEWEDGEDWEIIGGKPYMMAPSPKYMLSLLLDLL